MFQQSILSKYKTAVVARIASQYALYAAYFHNPEIQENIRNSKEEQFQEGFLRELFVKILGYTLNPEPKFNLITEQKNVANAKKADGAMLVKGEVVGVIELKDTKTTDLKQVEAQAFGYKNNNRNTSYVVISNFEKLRFYIDNVLDYIEFDLFHLTEDEFATLWICLAYESIERDLPRQIKSESVNSEDQITKQLYKDYSDFKRDLFADICEKNPSFDKLLLFKKTQKLLDRLLFIFFAEDKNLLPPNSIMKIVEQWQQLKELDEYRPLYHRFKKYFGHMNTGYKGQQYEIFAYNGGLFKPDEVLDSIEVADDLLSDYTKRLSAYDFDSEVDVNILGRIFENSLSEIEEVSKQLAQGESIEADQASKRKKDGVFYTPSYITSYIVEQTLGVLCANKKAELKIKQTEYFADAKRQKATTKRLLEQLEVYREWLRAVTICDPACGSGAFLNAALDFLMAEHKLIDEMQAKITGSSIVFQNVENAILENNLYGVDINEESVEIAKLALWLRTAKPNRKLTSLNENIKCGNSLISDAALSDKPFNWQEAFPKVFEQGGFDIVIGNPPYVQLQKMGEESVRLSQCGFESYNKSADLYCLFTEQGYRLMKPNGLMSFIMPNKWMLASYGKELRKFLSDKALRQILNFGDVQFFEEATTYVCIFVIEKACRMPEATVQVLSTDKVSYLGDFNTTVLYGLYDCSIDVFGEDDWIVASRDHFEILSNIERSVKLETLPIDIYRGILTGYNDAFFIDEATKTALIEKDASSIDLIRPLLKGRNFIPYGFEYEHIYLICTFPALNIDIEQYPAIKEHLLGFGYDRLKQTGDKGARKKTSGKWFEIQDSIAYYASFDKPKIMYPQITSVMPFVYDDEGYVCNDKGFILTAHDDTVSLLYLTALFNSKLAKLWIWYKCPDLQGGTREIRKEKFQNFPLPSAESDAVLAALAETRVKDTKELQRKVAKFLKRLSDNFSGIKLTGAIKSFYELDFAAFLKELKKQKIDVTLKQQDEWEDYFEQYRKECTDLSARIASTDQAINTRVYALYQLSEAHIKVLEDWKS